MRRSGVLLRHPPQLARHPRVGKRGPLLRTRWPAVVGLLALLVLPAIPGTHASPPALPMLARGAPAHAIGPNPAPAAGPGPAPSSPSPLTTVLKILNASHNGRITRTFWGLDLQPYLTIGGAFGSYLNSTQIRLARWPGGSIADGFNYTTNQITYHTGGTYVAPFNTSEFISWCRMVSCVSIFQLPGETNRSATAAYYVRYVEQTLGFHPNYWEIGNEPAIWTHYNLPWSQWAHAAPSKITAMGYALLVQRFVKAIRAVDPNAKILGLPGVGMGAWLESTWIYDTVKVNGPNLTGIAIHVYPAGRTLDVNGTLPQFYRTLNMTGALTHRLPSDEAAIDSACPKCNLGIFVTEAGSGTDISGTIAGTIGTAMGTFPQVPYIAALSIQAMNTQVRSIDFYTLSSSYPGAFYNSSCGAFRPVATLFSTIMPHFEPDLLVANTAGLPRGVFLVASKDPTGQAYSILVADTNTTTSVRLPLLGTGVLALGFGEIWSWGPGASAPSAKTWSGATPGSFTVPAESVVLVKIATSASLL